MGNLIIVALLVLIGSAICACTETAILSVSPIRVRHLAQSNNAAASVLLDIRQNINHPIATIVMINNLFNILGSIFIGSLASEVFANVWLGVFSGFFTFIMIIFAEIIPKTFAERYSLNVGLFVAIPVKFLTIIFYPLTVIIEKLTLPFIKREKLPSTSEAEIQLLASIGRKEGVIGKDEAEMIERVFQLNDLTALSLMTPRIIITYLREDWLLGEYQDTIINSEHSRIIVIGETIDNVVGVALKHELLTAIIEGKKNQSGTSSRPQPISSFIRPVNFVPETMTADNLLKSFQTLGEHLMVVLDEFGGVAGVITLEDVLEVLIGPIVDETDKFVDLQQIARRKRKILLEARGVMQEELVTKT